MTTIEDLTAIHHLVAGVLPRLDHALTRMHGQVAGYPSTASGGDHGGGGSAELTGPERIMAAAECGEVDEARTKIRRTHHLVRKMRAIAHELDDITNQFAPDMPPSKAEDERTVAGQAPDGCCRSCYRNGGEKVPVAKRYSGKVQLCYWCGNWRATHGGDLPPIQLVRLHLSGGVITSSIASRYMRDVATRAPGSRKPTKKDQRAQRMAAYDRQAQRLRAEA